MLIDSLDTELEDEDKLINSKIILLKNYIYRPYAAKFNFPPNHQLRPKSEIGENETLN
jgi:hypothetical protein